MKTRTGFVSNSSSSSFIAYGATVTPQQSIDIIDILAPGKIFETFAPKLNDYYIKNNQVTNQHIHDDLEFREALVEALENGWPVEYYDLYNYITLPIDFQYIYDDNRIVIGSVVDIEDQDTTIPILGKLIHMNTVENINNVLASVGLVPELLIGRQAC